MPNPLKVSAKIYPVKNFWDVFSLVKLDQKEINGIAGELYRHTTGDASQPGSLNLRLEVNEFSQYYFDSTVSRSFS